jgi:hypothetical protein
VLGVDAVGGGFRPWPRCGSRVAEAGFDEARLVDGAGVAQGRPDGWAEQVADAAGVATGGLGLVKEAVLPEPAGGHAENKTSLCEITPADVRAVLPPAGVTRTRIGQGLRSLFRVLKARRMVFTDPARQVRTGSPTPPS